MIVGIDLGGTKTRVVAELDGAVVFDRSVTTDSWRRAGLLDDAGNTARLLGLFAELDNAGSAALVVGAHGLDSEWQVREFNARLAERHAGPSLALNDVELLAPAAGEPDAIAVIAGTGSKVVGRAADGAVVSVGGHGFLLGDPGSAAALTREAVRAVLDAYDRGASPDALARELMSAFAVDDVVDLAHALTADVRLTVWAELAPLVFTAEAVGSASAATVIDDAARQLARDVGRVRAKGALGESVICAGGVISNQPLLFRALTRHIEGLDLGLTVRQLTVAPVFGAVELARHLHDSPQPSTPWRTA